MREQGLVENLARGYGRSRGRPETFWSLTEHGIALLNDEDILPSAANTLERCARDGIRCIDHQLLLNWFLIHLKALTQSIPEIDAEFLAPNSPFCPVLRKGISVTYERIPDPLFPGREVSLMPDGVFALSKRDEKALLFFLEVDMGTEALRGPSQMSVDVHQKILKYDNYFELGQYKRYEYIFNSTFEGFRLLFLTNSPVRLKALCRLVEQFPRNEFIWLTDQKTIFDTGLGDSIWIRGGHELDRRYSLLGSHLAQPTPVPHIPE